MLTVSCLKPGLQRTFTFRVVMRKKRESEEWGGVGGRGYVVQVNGECVPSVN